MGGQERHSDDPGDSKDQAPPSGPLGWWRQRSAFKRARVEGQHLAGEPPVTPGQPGVGQAIAVLPGPDISFRHGTDCPCPAGDDPGNIRAADRGGRR